jgi:hypothetical protein
MKKVYGYFGFFLLNLVLFEIGGVLAETNFERIINSISFTGNFSIILFGILLWMILYSVFKSMNIFEDNPWWSGGISLIVTILSFIYLPQGFIDGIGISYGALGGTILTVIPFAIAIYFTVWVSTNLAIARGIWLVFALYYLILSLSVENGLLDFFNKLNNFSGFSGFLDLVRDPSTFYFVAFLASVILFVVIGPIRKIWWEEHVKGVGERINRNIDEFGLGLRAGREVARTAAGKRKR